MEDNMSNIINNFKNMLNNDSSANCGSQENTTSNNSSDFNITPEMLGNLASVFQNFGANQNSESSQNFNANQYYENSQNSNINQDFNAGTNPSNSTDTNNSQDSYATDSQSSNGNFSSSIDFESILKIKSIMETLNKKDDPRSNLLYSLKPYLRENRQRKLDQYVNLLKITQITGLFKKEKGDGK